MGGGIGCTPTPSSSLTPLHRIFIYGTHVLLQLRPFWDTFRAEIADEGPYKAGIGGMRLELQELQEEDDQAR